MSGPQAVPVERCRRCRSPIRWVRTEAKGKLMPLDVDPTPDGTVELVQVGPVQRARVHHQSPLDAGELFMPHFATCPSSSSWTRTPG